MSPAPIRGYRQSYVEKDRCVRNSTAIQVPGVDVMQGFTMSKSEFENVFLQTAETMDDPSRSASFKRPSASAAEPRPSLFTRKKTSNARRRPLEDSSMSSLNSTSNVKAFRGEGEKIPLQSITTAEEAADFAHVCRKHAASLQRSVPPDYDGAGEFFEKAVDARALHGLFCTVENADAHVEYAQNLSKRGLTPEAEYHLRTAADVYRMLNARTARKYGDVLLYMAVVIDRQGRLAEAENFYRSALAVYRANKLSDDNVRVAIDSLGNNLHAQGRSDEVDVIVRRHFLGALD